MAPHVEFQRLPPELSFLRGDVDLGFENLGLTSQQQQALRAAFQGDGVVVPATTYKLRQLPNSVIAVVESATGLEPVLPDNWKQGAYTLAGNVFTYIGKQVRPDQIGNVDLCLYRDVGEGWELIVG